MGELTAPPFIMLSTCLDNLIGINNQCSTVTPQSGLFMQDLPLISIELANAGVKEESDGVQLMNDVIDFAEERMLQDFRTFMQPFARQKSIIQNDTIGFYTPDLQPVALEANLYKGLRVELDERPYLSLHVKSVKVLLDTSLTTVVRVFDLLTGVQLSTHSVTTVANVPTEIFINQTYFTDKQDLHLFFAIDSGLAGTFETNVHSNQLTNAGGCRGCRATVETPYAQFEGFSIPQASVAIDDNLTSIQGSNGLSMNYSVQCNIDPFLCNVSNLLGWPLVNLAGAELLRRLQYSDRLNSYVTVLADDVEALRKELMDDYTQSMNDILDNMQIPRDICFDCNETIKNVITIP